MNIKQIVYNSAVNKVCGLGDDGKMYYWGPWDGGEWSLLDEAECKDRIHTDDEEQERKDIDI